MYEDGQDEIVFSVDTPCQLLGAGLCGTEGAFTAELELLEVEVHSASSSAHESTYCFHEHSYGTTKLVIAAHV